MVLKYPSDADQINSRVTIGDMKSSIQGKTSVGGDYIQKNIPIFTGNPLPGLSMQ